MTFESHPQTGLNVIEKTEEGFHATHPTSGAYLGLFPTRIAALAADGNGYCAVNMEPCCAAPVIYRVVDGMLGDVYRSWQGATVASKSGNSRNDRHEAEAEIVALRLAGNRVMVS